MTANTYDPGEDGAKMRFDDGMSYGDYLHLDKLLAAQQPRSDAHDEMLFIVQHQSSELWMRLIIHELTATRTTLQLARFAPAFKMLTRVARIFEQLNSAWDVLRTMTPSEYTHFREHLGNSSGFQSYQYRLIEFMLGNRNPNMMSVHAHDAAAYAQLARELTSPSLYDVVIDLLYRALDGETAAAPTPRLSEPHGALDEVQQRWQRVYEDPDQYWDLYELAEKLVDLEDYFRRWRFNHVTTVERVIGFKRGTGGTSGVPYLRRMLEVELFPELWRVRGAL